MARISNVKGWTTVNYSETRGVFLKYTEESTQKFLQFFGLSKPINENIFILPEYKYSFFPRLYDHSSSWYTLNDYYVENLTQQHLTKWIVLPGAFVKSAMKNSKQYCTKNNVQRLGLEFIYFGFDSEGLLIVFTALNKDLNFFGDDRYLIENVLNVFSFHLKETSKYGNMLDFEDVGTSEVLHTIEPFEAHEICNFPGYSSEALIRQLRLLFYATSSVDDVDRKHSGNYLEALQESTLLPELIVGILAKDPTLPVSDETNILGWHLEKIDEAIEKGLLDEDILFSSLRVEMSERVESAVFNANQLPELLKFMDPSITPKLSELMRKSTYSATFPLLDELVRKQTTDDDDLYLTRIALGILAEGILRSECMGSFLAYGNLDSHFKHFGLNEAPESILEKAKTLVQKMRLEDTIDPKHGFEEDRAYRPNQVEPYMNSVYRPFYNGSKYFRRRELPASKKRWDDQKRWPDWPKTFDARHDSFDS